MPAAGLPVNLIPPGPYPDFPWKTSVGITILGIVLYAALNGFFWLTLQESFASTVSDLWP